MAVIRPLCNAAFFDAVTVYSSSFTSVLIHSFRYLLTCAFKHHVTFVWLADRAVTLLFIAIADEALQLSFVPIVYNLLIAYCL
jgi:hypothetical protein